jgi:hypothetical protein
MNLTALTQRSLLGAFALALAAAMAAAAPPEAADIDSAAVATPARLWRATRASEGRTQQVIYLFGLTHYGFPSEHDAYFDDVVVPAARTAPILFAEGVGQVPLPWAEPACATPLRDRALPARVERVRRRLAQAYARQMLAGIEASGAVLTRELRDGVVESAEPLAANLSEYGLVSWATLMSGQIVAHRPARDAGEGRPILGALMKAVPFDAVQDVDPAGLQRDAYCRQGDARVAALELLTALDGLEASPAAAAEAARSNALAERDWRRSLSLQRSVGFWSSMPKTMAENVLCLRNASWLDRMTSQGIGRPAFYALGFGHLLPTEGLSCPGLLADLKQRGFEVERLDKPER